MRITPISLISDYLKNPTLVSHLLKGSSCDVSRTQEGKLT